MAILLKDLTIGQSAEFRKTITEADVLLFAGISGDLNPAHIDEVHAQGTFFGKRIAHGMLSAGLISAVLGNRLPGPGTIYLSQELQFRAPVYIGDTIAARAEVIEIYPEKKRVRLKTNCYNQDEKEVLRGEALVQIPE